MLISIKLFKSLLKFKEIGIFNCLIFIRSSKLTFFVLINSSKTLSLGLIYNLQVKKLFLLLKCFKIILNWFNKLQLIKYVLFGLVHSVYK